MVLYIYHTNIVNVWKINLDDIDTRDVPESLGDTLVLVIDDEGAQLLHMAPAPQLTLAGAHTAGGVNPKYLCLNPATYIRAGNLLGDIGPSLVPPEELDSLLCASEALDGVGHHQRHLQNSHESHVIYGSRQNQPQGFHR